MGPIFSPNLILGAKVAADLNFTYGFDLTVSHLHLVQMWNCQRERAKLDLKVPNNSSITLNIGNLTNSSMTGL